MAKLYKTARGKMIDVDRIRLQNENTLTVGNMKTNARGDLLGPKNEIAVSRNQLMDQIYSVPEADTPYSPTDPENYMAQQRLIEATDAKKLNDLAKNLTVPVEKPAESVDSAPQPATRGSLASSVAKSQTVTQEPLPDPRTVRKNNGPSRI